MEPYREKILLTYKFLLKTHEELLTRTINVGMLGELAEVNKVFAVGDTYNFEIEQFKGTPDANLNKLIDFYDALENLMNSLANINAITEEELEELEELEDFEEDDDREDI
ncbi:MAG: hypothetical protein R6W85_07225 [Gillisia sp.]